MVLNMGPQHPSTHGVLRVLLELDGETVVKTDVDIGYLHTGIEKTAEALTYSQTITITDRMDYLAPLSNNLAYCLAVEKLLGLEVPKRAQYIRVLLTELTRIGSHLVWLGTHAIDLGAMSAQGVGRAQDPRVPGAHDGVQRGREPREAEKRRKI